MEVEGPSEPPYFILELELKLLPVFKNWNNTCVFTAHAQMISAAVGVN